MRDISPAELATILEQHGKWLRGEKAGVRANLSSANLSFANLSSANLSFANLSFANLRFADLSSANLSSANLSFANLSSANLSSADLSFADLSFADDPKSVVRFSDETVMPEGVTWKEYLGELVPALLSVGGKEIAEVATAWDCHSWSNCPMAVAFGVHDPEAVPALYRAAVRDFVWRFDAGIIPRPKVEGAAV